ncbi:MAG: hypothetical protein ACKODL_12055, partial [Phenylobacterium sp.]
PPQASRQHAVPRHRPAPQARQDAPHPEAAGGQADIDKIWGGTALRALKAAEAVRDRLNSGRAD